MSDYDMPGLDGLELLDTLRTIDPEIPFVLFTGHGNEEIASEAISAGVTDYLRKETGTEQYAVLANRVANTVSKRRAERELERRTEQFEKTFEHAGDALFLFDPAIETITECNTAACEMFGYPREELLDLSPEAVQPTQMDQFHSFIERVLETGEGWIDDFSYLTSDGQRLSSEISASRIDLDDRPYVLGSARDVTDRTHRERELETAQARFRSLTENASFVVLTIDEENVVQYANDAVEETFRYTADEMVGGSLDRIVPDRLERTHTEAVARYLREGDRRIDWEWIELPARHRDGHEFPVGISFGEYVADGEHIFTGVLRDITERKEREEALERSEELLDKTQRMANVGGWELDLRDGDLRWTDEANRIYGFELDYEPTLDDALDSFLSEDRATLEDAMDRAIEDGEHYDLELRLYAASGDLRWVRALGEPHCEDGETVMLRGTIQDITDRKEQQRQFEAIFNQTFQSTGLMDPDGTLLEANETVLRFGGIDREDVVGEYIWDSYWWKDTPEGRERVREAVSRARSGEFVRYEQEVTGAEDTAIIDFSIKPATDEEGAVVLLVPEGRDISALKERERELERQNERLEQFASVLSHDLRNPLSIAEGYLNFLPEAGNEEPLEKVRNAHGRMERIIEDMLALTRQGESIEETRPVSLTGTVEMAWEHVATDRATLTVADDLGTIEADRSRLETVFENLFRNAVEHGREDVRIAVGPLADGDGFFVADDGPGVPADELERIFEYGHSTGDTGAGLGLSIVDTIADAHGWTVAVTESDRGGARFEVSVRDAASR